MDFGSTYDKGMQWVFAVLASIALHVVILAAFAWSSMGGAGETRAAAAPKKPEVQEVSAEKAQETEAESESQSREKNTTHTKAVVQEPTAKPKPKAESKSKPEVKPKSEAKAKSVVREKEPQPMAEADEPQPENEKATKADLPRIETKAYVVKRGDTLKRIAQESGCSMQELADINGMPLRRFANLKVGQKIKVPMPKGSRD